MNFPNDAIYNEYMEDLNQQSPKHSRKNSLNDSFCSDSSEMADIVESR